MDKHHPVNKRTVPFGSTEIYAHREKRLTQNMWVKRYEQFTLICECPVADTQAFAMSLQKGEFYWKPDLLQRCHRICSPSKFLSR